MQVQETFKRVEDKYRLTREQACEVINRICDHVHEDDYFQYTVHSIYYDSPDCGLVTAGLNGGDYKAKLRMRGYNEVSGDSPVFLETKKKFENIVYKKRMQMTNDEAFPYMLSHDKNKASGNTAQEIEYMRDHYRLVPKVLITYDRICFAADGEQDVRVTFDTHIRYRIRDLDDMNDNGTEIPLEEDCVMLEIKAMDRYPMWLVNILSDMKLRRTSFSKYATVYRRHRNEMAPLMNVHAAAAVPAVKPAKENQLCSLQF